RAHAEIDAVVGHDRLPKRTDETLLPYIRAIIREELRFRPPGGWISFPHQSIKEDTYEGFHIPADTSIVANVWAMHMDSVKYVNPEKFMPERYLNVTESSAASANGPIADRDHVAFGWGRRLCPGIHLTDAEAFVATALLLWSYKIEVEEGGGLPNINKWTLGVTMHPKPYKVKFVPRHDKVKELLFA
ncbi:cytochrome P450, partial [Jimgerdemannia flammicorona]